MRLSWLVAFTLVGCAPSSSTPNCGIPAGSPAFYSCLCGSDCQAGHLCVGVPGGTAYCRPPCTVASECSPWLSTYPSLTCVTIPVQGGGVASGCADYNHNPADVVRGIGSTVTPVDAGQSRTCGSFASCSTPSDCTNSHRLCSSGGGGPSCCMGVCSFQYCDCDGDRVSCETFVGSGTCPPGSPGAC